MQAEVITIGDEILIGQIIDSNSAYIAKKLNSIGIEIAQIRSISDKEEDILSALASAQDRVPLVIMTGGLGPTKDDITKHCFCTYFEDELVHNPQVLLHIEKLFAQYVKVPINDLNRAQAMLPSKAVLLDNPFGTAVGMWMNKGKTVFVSMPGVPYEMKNMMEQQLLPKLKQHFDRPAIVHKTMLTYGWGESRIAEVISDWETALPKHIKLAYLPNLGRVRLRLTARGVNEKVLSAEVDQLFERLYPLIGEIITGFESDQPIEAQIGILLNDLEKSIATAESCTGGRIAAALTSVPGASAYFAGGAVPYKTELKMKLLEVPASLIDTHSVVSAEVALAMAEGVRKQFSSDYGLATTGNAGPQKGDSDADVGTVYVALVGPGIQQVEHFNFGNHREKTTQKTVNKALEMTLKHLKSQVKKHLPIH
ncbi:MAG: competence/damage-inducible protein A [Flavobacteriaceae bacterium]